MGKSDEPKIVRLRNVDSGVVVTAREDTAERLSGSWEPADKAAAKSTKTTK